jgi:hypothetical protein
MSTYVPKEEKKVTRYNVFYAFRPEPSSGLPVLTTALCSVTELWYQDI